MERNADLDGKAKESGAAFNVALFAHKEYIIKDDSSTFGWAVTTKKSERNKGFDSFKVVLLPEGMRKLQDRMSSILSSPYLETGNIAVEGFKKGRPLMSSLSTPIHACVGESRPQVLYRAVHEGHPGNGLRSRGFGTIKTDAISFMLHFHHHLNWKRRDASPFMSATTDLAQAGNIAKTYEREGFHNIEILVIKVDESEWRTQSTMWHVMQTAARLGLIDVLRKSYCKSEYLIEDYIPASCVARERWEDMKADFEAETTMKSTRTRQSRKRCRSDFESNGSGDETALSGGRPRKVWGVKETARGYSLCNP